MNRMVATLAGTAGLEAKEASNSICIVDYDSETVVASPTTATVYSDNSWRDYSKEQAQDLHDYLSVKWGVEEAYYD